MPLNPHIDKDSSGVYWLRWTTDPAALVYDIITPAGRHVQTGKTKTEAKLGSGLAEPVKASVAPGFPGPYEQAVYPVPAPTPIPPVSTFTVTQTVKDGQEITAPITWAAVPSSAAAKVDFFVDGSLKHTENISPYIFNGDGNFFDPAAFTDGQHELKAVAYDAAGKTASVVSKVTTKKAVTPTPVPPPTGAVEIGRVKTFWLNNSGNDYVTNNPTQASKDFMNAHLDLIYGWDGWWAQRKSWYPRVVCYKDSYACYKNSMGQPSHHPEWVLKDAAGNLLYIPWGCAGGTCPQFAFDPGNQGWRDYYANDVLKLVNAGFFGLFADDVNLDRIATSNGNGTPVTPWNPRTNSLFTLDQWQHDFADFMTYVRTKVKAVNPNFIIVHNSLWWAKGTWVESCIKAADIFCLERGFSDGNYNADGFKRLFAWLDYLHSLDRGAYHLPYANDQTQAELNLACALITSNGKDSIQSYWGMFPPGIDSGWWPVFDAHLGAGSPRTYNSVNGLHRREFEKGVALFLEPGRPDVSSDGAYLKARTGKVILR